VLRTGELWRAWPRLVSGCCAWASLPRKFARLIPEPGEKSFATKIVRRFARSPYSAGLANSGPGRGSTSNIWLFRRRAAARQAQRMSYSKRNRTRTRTRRRHPKPRRNKSKRPFRVLFCPVRSEFGVARDQGLAGGSFTGLDPRKKVHSVLRRKFILHPSAVEEADRVPGSTQHSGSRSLSLGQTVRLGKARAIRPARSSMPNRSVA